MGSCTSRPNKSSGQRLSSTTGTGTARSAQSTSSNAPNPNSQEERERRAKAAEERLNASKTRGTNKTTGPGALSKKLEQEQLQGGTGSRGDSQITRGQEAEIRRWD